MLLFLLLLLVLLVRLPYRSSQAAVDKQVEVVQWLDRHARGTHRI